MLLIAITAAPMFGQVSYYGTIRGLIHDPTGAVVPNANLTLVDEPRNLTRTTTSNTSGEYVFVDVTPSTYTVSVQAAGFKRIEQLGYALDSP